MSRETSHKQKIALLATGDEIVQGDILNTNCQHISLQLTNNNITVGSHATVGDNIADIESAMAFLLKNHQGLIITGGLGPTSDDLTRYALGKLINLPLIFHAPTWDTICQRLKQFGYDIPPESNRQQALFPEGATIIPNPNGTAAGCWININHQFIFMLPGPPNECLPLVDTVVLPTLIKAGYQQTLYRETWLLFGASEGKIAEELDQIAKPFDCTTGYRLCYPYLEFKIHSYNPTDFAAVVLQIEKAIQPYLIGNGKQTASEQVKLQLEQHNGILGICDFATGGLLESTIKTPLTCPHLLFSTHTADFGNTPYLHISGLDEFWQGKQTIFQTKLQLKLHHLNTEQNRDVVIPFRGERVKPYAVEWICSEILKTLK